MWPGIWIIPGYGEEVGITGHREMNSRTVATRMPAISFYLIIYIPEVH